MRRRVQWRTRWPLLRSSKASDRRSPRALRRSPSRVDRHDLGRCPRTRSWDTQGRSVEYVCQASPKCLGTSSFVAESFCSDHCPTGVIRYIGRRERVRLWSVQMGSWLVVVGPAFGTALMVRIDAVFVGPYFALSSLIAGYEGVLSFVDDRTRRRALVRRFTYPVIQGMGLFVFGANLADATASGTIAALLLIWPAVFHGFPTGVVARTWRLSALYVSLVVSYASLSVAGYLVIKVAITLPTDQAGPWLLQSLLGLVLTSAVASIALAFFRATARVIKRRVDLTMAQIGWSTDEQSGSGNTDEPDSPRREW